MSEGFDVQKWKEVVSCYVRANGNAQRAWKTAKKRLKLTREQFEVMVYDGAPEFGIPPAHDMFLKAARAAVETTQVEVTESLMETLEIVRAYKIPLAKKIQSLDKNPELVTDKVGQELHKVYQIERGVLDAMAGRAGMSEEEMDFVEAQETAKEAQEALARTAGDDDYELNDKIKIKGDNVVPIRKEG